MSRCRYRCEVDCGGFDAKQVPTRQYEASVCRRYSAAESKHRNTSSLTLGCAAFETDDPIVSCGVLICQSVTRLGPTKRLNASRSCLGSIFLGAQGTLRYKGKGKWGKILPAVLDGKGRRLDAALAELLWPLVSISDTG